MKGLTPVLLTVSPFSSQLEYFLFNKVGKDVFWVGYVHVDKHLDIYTTTQKFEIT